MMRRLVLGVVLFVVLSGVALAQDGAGGTPLDLPLGGANTYPFQPKGSAGVSGKSPLDLPLSEVPPGTKPIPELPLPSSAGKGSGRKASKVVREYDFGVSKDIPVTGRALPPVGELPDGVRQVDPTVVYVRDGVMYEVKVSRWMPNRISTPFIAPKVVDASRSQVRVLGGDVFLLPAKSEPFAVYITEGDQRRVGVGVISLLLIPEEKLPAQNVVVAFEDLRKRGVEERLPWTGTDAPYVASIKEIFRDVVRGRIPEGFTRTKFSGDPVAFMGGVIRVSPYEYYAGVGRMIVVYELTNTGREAVELTEESFYRQGVRAVAFFPDIVLMPGKKTFLYVLVDEPLDEPLEEGK